jgi:hypothetical protein
VTIPNEDNRCLVRATLVALASACQVNPDEYHRTKARQLTLTAGEILVRFGACLRTYYRHLRDNDRRKPDHLTEQVCEVLGVGDQPLTYALIPSLEGVLNVNIYVVSAARGDKFSYVSSNHDTERKKVFLHHDDIEEHFHTISNITDFFTQAHFCQHCLVPYEKPFRHNCVKHCNVCLSYDCKKGDAAVIPLQIDEELKFIDEKWRN